MRFFFEKQARTYFLNFVLECYGMLHTNNTHGDKVDSQSLRERSQKSDTILRALANSQQVSITR